MSTKSWVILAVVIGFLGAAAFYSPYIGINGQTTIECPFCAHVTMSGSPVRHFVGLTILGGIVNAAFLAAVTSLLILASRMFVRIKRFSGEKTK